MHGQRQRILQQLPISQSRRTIYESSISQKNRKSTRVYRMGQRKRFRSRQPSYAALQSMLIAKSPQRQS